MQYLTRTDLIMPEYGRNIQKMVEHAVSIEDRQERTECAQSIINVMGSMFPYLRDVDGFKFKLWDHLAIMSKFKLDIDYPFDVIKSENLAQKPAKIPYNSKKMRFLHYGATIERFIKTACALPEGEERAELTASIANYMKKSLLAWNREIATDNKVIDDLCHLSKGKIALNAGEYRFINPDELNQNRKKNNNNNRRKQKTKR